MYHHSFTTDLKRGVDLEPQAISLTAKNITIAAALALEPNRSASAAGRIPPRDQRNGPVQP